MTQQGGTRVTLFWFGCSVSVAGIAAVTIIAVWWHLGGGADL